MKCRACGENRGVSTEAREILEKVGWVEGGQLTFCPHCLKERKQTEYVNLASQVFSPLWGSAIVPTPDRYVITMWPQGKGPHGQDIRVEKSL